MSDTRVVVAANIRARLAWNNIRVTEMAHRVGLSQQTLSNKLTGLREFRSGELSAIAQELGLTDPGPLFVIPTGWDAPIVESDSAWTTCAPLLSSVYAAAA